MHRIAALCFFALALACGGAGAQGQVLSVGASDTVQSVLGAQKGKRVTVRLRSGQELTGAVREVGTNVVHLGAIGGREFFDAVVPLAAVEARLVRTK